MIIHIIHKLGISQTPRTGNGVSVPPVQDEYFFNTYQITVWIGIHDNYTLCKKGGGGVQVETGIN